MNNFANDEEPSIFENFAGRIREIDRPLDAVTKAKLFRQPHCGVAHRNQPTGATDFLDDIAAIMGFDLLLHGSHDIRRAEVHFLPGGCAAGNQICAHILIVILSAANNLGSLVQSAPQP